MKRKSELAPPPKSLWRRVWQARMGYLFILPLMLGLLIFSYYPAFSGIYHSFFDWDSVGTAKFIGVENYRELFRDEVFLTAFGTMLKIQLPKLLIGIIVPLIMAEMIFCVRSQRAQYWYRILILFPIVTPGVVSTLIWKFIYDPNGGLLTSLLRAVGIMDATQVISWLEDPRWVIFAVIFMGFPWIGGTSVLIYMSGLMNIPTEVMESATLDGCGVLRRIVRIDLPTIMGQVRYFLIMGIIGALQDYSLQLMLTDGGPGYSTMVPGYYMYLEAFTANRMGYACAIGTTLFLIIFVITAVTYRYIRSDA